MPILIFAPCPKRVWGFVVKSKAINFLNKAKVLVIDTEYNTLQSLSMAKTQTQKLEVSFHRLTEADIEAAIISFGIKVTGEEVQQP